MEEPAPKYGPIGKCCPEEKKCMLCRLVHGEVKLPTYTMPESHKRKNHKYLPEFYPRKKIAAADSPTQASQSIFSEDELDSSEEEEDHAPPRYRRVPGCSSDPETMSRLPPIPLGGHYGQLLDQLNTAFSEMEQGYFACLAISHVAKDGNRTRELDKQLYNYNGHMLKAYAALGDARARIYELKSLENPAATGGFHLIIRPAGCHLAMPPSLVIPEPKSTPTSQIVMQ
jgi:hypothetical protein